MIFGSSVVDSCYADHSKAKSGAGQSSRCARVGVPHLTPRQGALWNISPRPIISPHTLQLEVRVVNATFNLGLPIITTLICPSDQTCVSLVEFVLPLCVRNVLQSRLECAVTVHRMSLAAFTMFGRKGLSGVSRRPQVVPKHCQGISSLQTLKVVKSVSSKYVGYIASLMAWLVRIGPWSREDAEDLIQEGMLRLWEYRLTVEVRNERALLNCIVKRLAANKLIQRRRVIFEQESVEELADCTDLEDPSADPQRRVAVQQRLEMMQRLLDAYSPRNGKIYFAHRAGYTHREIAEAFAIDESTVEKHIARAVYRLMNLKERL